MAFFSLFSVEKKTKRRRFLAQFPWSSAAVERDGIAVERTVLQSTARDNREHRRLHFPLLETQARLDSVRSPHSLQPPLRCPTSPCPKPHPPASPARPNTTLSRSNFALVNSPTRELSRRPANGRRSRSTRRRRCVVTSCSVLSVQWLIFARTTGEQDGLDAKVTRKVLDMARAQQDELAEEDIEELGADVEYVLRSLPFPVSCS